MNHGARDVKFGTKIRVHYKHTYKLYIVMFSVQFRAHVHVDSICIAKGYPVEKYLNV